MVKEEELDTEDQNAIFCPFSQYKGLSVGISKKRIAKEVQAALYKYMGKGGVLFDKVREQFRCRSNKWLHWNDRLFKLLVRVRIDH